MSVHRSKTIGEVWNQANRLIARNYEEGKQTDLRTKRGKQLKSREERLYNIAARYIYNMKKSGASIVPNKMVSNFSGAVVVKPELEHSGTRVSRKVYMGLNQG